MYDGGEIITEVDGENQVLANYTHSNLRTDDVLSVQITEIGKTQGLAKNAGNYFYLKDSLGTISDITDGAGNLIQHFVYSPFGEIIKVTNKLNEDISSDWSIRTSYTFTNREYDEESGLYYYRARYYDASTGRFLQQDPYPGENLRPSSFLNKYTYTENNPLKYADSGGARINIPAVWGNWCGPYNNDGKDWSPEAQDGLDERCKKHDQDYASADAYVSKWRGSSNFFAPYIATGGEMTHYFYHHFIADMRLIASMFNHNSWRNNSGKYDLTQLIAANAVGGYFVNKTMSMGLYGLSPTDAVLFSIDKIDLIRWYADQSTMKSLDPFSLQLRLGRKMWNKLF